VSTVFKTLIYNKTTQEKHERQISGVASTGGKSQKSKSSAREGRGGNSKRGRGHNNLNNIEAKSYTREEWLALSEEQRAKVKVLRTAKKAATGENRHTSSSTISSVTHDSYQADATGYQQDAVVATSVPPSTPQIRFDTVTKPPTKP
jgi:hypothetical protein